MIRGALVAALRDTAVPRFAPAPLAASRVAGLLLERYGEDDCPHRSAEELAALLRRLRDAAFDWAKVAPSDRADIVWVLWQGEDPPAEHPVFLQRFLRWIETPWRRVQARRLASSWAAAWDRDSDSVATVGAWLDARAPRLGEPWPRLAETAEIFSERGPMTVARRFLASTEGALPFWQGLGLPPRSAAGGWAGSCAVAVASLVRPRLRDAPELAMRLIDFAHAVGVLRASPGAVRGMCAAGAVRARLAEALLLPWGNVAPPAAVKELTIGFLLDHYGDPRVTRALAAVAPAATKILRDWLNREAIATFFHLAAQASPTQKPRWQTRARLWLAALDHLDDAWLILGTQAAARLKADNRGFGRLVGCGAEHGALLLKLGGLTIVESSHTGHERIWLAGNEQVPPRYDGSARAYSAAALAAGADFSSAQASHDGSRADMRLCDFIARHTNIRLGGDGPL